MPAGPAACRREPLSPHRLCHRELAEELHFHTPTVRPLSGAGPDRADHPISGLRQSTLRHNARCLPDQIDEERKHHDRGNAPDQALRQDRCGRRGLLHRPARHVTGFLGPNGAGKSTTMRMILGLDAPTSGDVRVDGKPYRQLANPLRSVGALLDAKAIVGGRSAPTTSCGSPTATASPGAGWPKCSTSWASRRGEQAGGDFSLGMNQRLGIAAALIGDPETVIFDEPINGLDPEGILWIRNLMRSLASEGRTVFLSSHLMSEMAQTADHLLVIGQGPHHRRRQYGRVHQSAHGLERPGPGRRAGRSGRDPGPARRADRMRIRRRRSSPDWTPLLSAEPLPQGHHPRRTGPTRVLARRGIFRLDQG